MGKVLFLLTSQYYQKNLNKKSFEQKGIELLVDKIIV